jgi:hypothetical protein
MGAVVAIAAVQLEVVAGDDRQQPVPVVLDLMQQPRPSGGWVLDETIWSETPCGISARTAAGGKAKFGVGEL